MQSHTTAGNDKPFPLAGQTVAVTRMAGQADALCKLLREAGAEVIETPTIALAPIDDYKKVDDALRAMAQYTWLVLTSNNGADAILTRLNMIGGDAQSLAGVKIAAIGTATAGRLVDLGLHVDLLPSEAVGEALAKVLIEQGVSGKRILLLRAERAREVLPQILSQAGAIVDELACYRTVCPESLPSTFLDRFDAGRIDWITLMSPSSFENLCVLLGESRLAGLRRVKLASIGPVTTQAIRAVGYAVAVEANPHNARALIAAMLAD